MKTGPTPPSRGRPRAFDRDTALDAALQVFWRHGYDATSLSELTAAMKISPPSLYAAFGSKKGLFLEAVDLYARRYGEGARRALEDAPTAKAAVTHLLMQSAAIFSAPAHPFGCFIALGAVNCAPGSAEVEAALRERRAASGAALRERIARGIEDGELPPGTDAAALARFYGAVIQGMSVQARDGASREALESVARAALLAWPARSSEDR
ncbi:TetR family transcriptional regulator [Sorangium cellulosum]|uniref:TetR family transcriptional regulator n=1 Tax=Sorangium cellulosum TaxID=56 RepID=A0A2L0EP11_SORCE|nr:TetR/AcrR family transcriptional regulator [Sorangium cellulosum]AUX40992.1 TetR family transcriptional regulator [Sorangium cellulosum]